MDIGIDLGTTFSVIAVNGNVRLADGYPEGIYLENCDVTVIPTPEGEQTFPSAAWEDPENPGRYVVGYEALLKTDEGEAPILFSKRKMGSTETIPMHGHTMFARDAAVEILKHLKACAERALGQPVERAVVSHPAYFDRNQVEETREAAIQAGFEMSLPDQMVMEPVAAALAYTRTDKRDPLRILTYDLGGGTFDVSYIERRGGVIFMRAFDGDHLLGGYNFDRELVHWLRQRLAAKGRQIVFDENDPQDRGRLARLLRLAEEAKIRIAQAPDDDTRVEIRNQDILVDTQGRRVAVLEGITRTEFVELIRPHLNTTIQCCHRILQKAHVDPKDIDEILLVGGSTYAPWVHEAVRAGLPGRTFKLFSPDLCVGAGAAIHAAMVLPLSVRHDRYRLTMDAPSESVLEQVDITGQVSTPDGRPVGGHHATLKRPGGPPVGPVPLSPNGAFVFGDIELLEDGPTHLVLLISDAGGGTVLEHPFDILYAPATADTTTVTTVLPKPLYLETLEGLVPLAQEGVCLPAKCREVLARDNDNPTIAIRIFQEGHPIGAIRVEDIPPEGGRGSRVEIEAIVTEKNQIRGQVRIFSPGGKLVKESDVRVTFDIVQVPDTMELARQFERLKSACLSVLQTTDDQEHEQRITSRAIPLIENISHLLEQQPLERQEVHAALKELAGLVKPPEDPMQPTKKAFLETLSSCRATVTEMHQKAEALLAKQGADASSMLDKADVAKAGANLEKSRYLSRMLDKAEREGLAAHGRKDSKGWAAANDITNMVQAQVQERPDLDPPPIILKLVAALSVDQELSRLASQHRRLESEQRLGDWQAEIDRLAGAIQTLRNEVMTVDDDQPRERVRAQLAVLITQRLAPIREGIARLGIDTHRRQ
ncbi:MAG TPA: Hsp70 family protein [Planctomycetota bacterium]|nr:Hsp70 family protein [Planctomycetota bacterium]